MKTRRGGSWFRRWTRKRSLSTAVKGVLNKFKKEILENSKCELGELQESLLTKFQTLVNPSNLSSTKSKGGAFNRRCTRLRPKNWFYTNKCCDMQKALKTKYKSKFNITVPSEYTNEECVDLLRTFANSQDRDENYDCNLVKSILIKWIEDKPFQQRIVEFIVKNNFTGVERAVQDLFSNVTSGTESYKRQLHAAIGTNNKGNKNRHRNESEEYETGFGTPTSKLLSLEQLTRDHENAHQNATELKNERGQNDSDETTPERKLLSLEKLTRDLENAFIMAFDIRPCDLLKLKNKVKHNFYKMFNKPKSERHSPNLLSYKLSYKLNEHCEEVKLYVVNLIENGELQNMVFEQIQHESSVVEQMNHLIDEIFSMAQE
jgi:hypothetical protein